MRRLHQCVFALAVLLSGGLWSPLWATTETVTVEVVGRGLDRDEAILAGLTEALRQVRGVQVVSTQQRSTRDLEVVVRNESGGAETVRFERTQSGQIEATTEGLIDGYQLLSAVPRNPGMEVRLRVDVPVFRGPGSESYNARRRLAVYPVVSAARPTLLGTGVIGEHVADRMTQSLIRAVTGTRRFAVLERERTREIEQEMALLADPATPLREAVRVGQAVGADYLLNATLVSMDVERRERVIQLTGERIRSLSGSVIVELRIVTAATRQIMWADTESIDVSQMGLDPAAASSVDLLVQQLSDLVAERLAFRAVEAIYPMRIVSVSPSGDVVVNQGGDRTPPGTRLTVYRLGEALVDPYSQQSLGRLEEFLGTVEVTRATSKVAYARLIDGDPRTLAESPDDLLVRVEETTVQSAQAEPAQTRVRPLILLPQDR